MKKIIKIDNVFGRITYRVAVEFDGMTISSMDSFDTLDAAEIASTTIANNIFVDFT
jgi:hypothetical protein